MLNTNIKLGNTSFKTPSTEILQRSSPISTFIRCGRGSQMEGMLFPSNGASPYIEVGWDEKKEEVDVLQILVFESDQYLIEIVKKKDLNNLNNND